MDATAVGQEIVVDWSKSNGNGLQKPQKQVEAQEHKDVQPQHNSNTEQLPAQAVLDQLSAERALLKVAESYKAAFAACATEPGLIAQLERMLRLLHWRGQKAMVLQEEWLVKPGWPQNGVGDLVFQFGGEDYEVEAKHIGTMTAGPDTLLASSKRQHVQEQAQRYARAWRAAHPQRTVHSYILTEVTGLLPAAEAAEQL